MSELFKFDVFETVKRNRLDEFLFVQFTSLSKIYLRNLITKGECRINGEITNSGYCLKAGDKIEIELDLTAETSMKPEDLQLDIVFEDEYLLVVDKPEGMLVHPTLHQKSGTLLNALSYYLNREKINALKETNTEFIRPGLVHRLDRKTSGLMLIAKTLPVLRILSDHFTRRLVKKGYLAIVHGNVAEDKGTIDAKIGHFEEERYWGIKTDGKQAITNFRVLERFSKETLMELEPVTGRTNQLRIHCMHIGYPIIGDDKYGGREFQRLCLHAAKIAFHHPSTNAWMEFESKIPNEMNSFQKI